MATPLPVEPTYTARMAEIAILIQALTARLLTGHSATRVLEAWCVERGLSRLPQLVAQQVSTQDKAASPAQRERLALASGEALRYRRVRLVCGPHVLSLADNWYVPGRLTADMNRVLESTQMPFGRVVHALAPTRRNLGLRTLWHPADAPLPGAEDELFAIDAVLSAADGVPFCEVGETYTGAVLLAGTA